MITLPISHYVLACFLSAALGAALARTRVPSLRRVRWGLAGWRLRRRIDRRDRLAGRMRAATKGVLS